MKCFYICCKYENNISKGLRHGIQCTGGVVDIGGFIIETQRNFTISTAIMDIQSYEITKESYDILAKEVYNYE